jgi:hypothetical protein
MAGKSRNASGGLCPFRQGAGDIFGHDWGEDGVMEAVHSFARQMQPPLPFRLVKPEPPDNLDQRTL